MPVEDLSKIISRNINDVQQLQAEDADNIDRNFVDPIDELGIDESINALTSSILDSTVVDYTRLDHSVQIPSGSKMDNLFGGSYPDSTRYTTFWQLQNIIDSGTRALWHMNETSGSSIVNDSLYSITVNRGSGGITQGHFHNARVFAGSEGYSIAHSSVVNDFTLAGSDVLFLESWVYPTGYAANEMYIFNKPLNYALCLTPGGNVRAYYSGVDLGSTVSTLSLNQWTHVAYSCNGNGEHKIYLNGSIALTNLTFINPGSSASDLVIGASAFSVSRYLNGFVGYLEEMRVSDKIRAKDEDSNYLAPVNSEAIKEYVQEATGSIFSTIFPGSARYYTPWYNYCGSWFNFYWSGSTPTNTTITTYAHDAAGSIWASGTSSPLTLSGIQGVKQIRFRFEFTNSNTSGVGTPSVSWYSASYNGNRLSDHGTAFI